MILAIKDQLVNAQELKKNCQTTEDNAITVAPTVIGKEKQMFKVLPNKEKVDKISIPIDIHCICTIGKETYTNQTMITLEKPDSYPEYIEFQQYLYETFEDKNFNYIEEILFTVKIFSTVSKKRWADWIAS